MTNLPRPEYPRPNFVRNEWLNLNGIWDFEFDDGNVGENEKWFISHNFSRQIVVPFCYESEMSGINDKGTHDYVWYRRTLNIPHSWKEKRIKLNFGAVDYITKVWINGNYIGKHTGGYTPFDFDITNFLKWNGNEEIVVKVEDQSFDQKQARGKQTWIGEPFACWYTKTTGIWQTVWLEPVSEAHIQKVRLTPDLDNGNIKVNVLMTQKAIGKTLRVKIKFEEFDIVETQFTCLDSEMNFALSLLSKNFEWKIKPWSPEEPNLYDIFLELIDDNSTVIDSVRSYFGMRKVSTKNGKFLLNNRSYYQKLILDQGYFPGSLLTPPSEEAIIEDIKMTKQLGYNGARKHQKVEDPLYLYWCDKLGLLVWGEMASFYEFTNEAISQYTREWQEIVDRDYNHPSIVVWTVFNESWGVPSILVDKHQQCYTISLVNMVRSLDHSRLVVSNDGWEHTDTDLCTIHDYIESGKRFSKIYENKDEVVNGAPANKFIFAEGFSYSNQPILITEYGGIAFSHAEGWGYGNKVTDEEDFLKRFSEITDAIKSFDYIVGYCYTQLTDVEQEVNGLLTYDRKFKIDPEKIKAINDRIV